MERADLPVAAQRIDGKAPAPDQPAAHTASSAAELLEIQRGAGAPITIDGSLITVMARGA